MNHNEDKSTTPQDNDEVTHNAAQADVSNESTEQNTADAHAKAQTANKQTSSESSINEPQQATDSFDDTNTADEVEKTWHNKNALKRGIAMLGYGFIAGFVRLGITIIAVFQFFSLLFAEKPNQPLVKFGQNLNTFLYQINQFLTVNSEVYPFPFADWPNSAPKG
ncbi:hypothetical protein NBRC116592_02640 [Colwellia sp. KU-HH00111]|uniref:DUF4389 domain-containing protein n=1 Tax=Colwellia sp. KU-HH00111 TaxID=3127652 RepID=UPI0031088308